MYQVGIYCRISREERIKEGKYSNSIHSQIQMARDFIESHNDINAIKVYADEGVSGSNFDRAEFQRMLTDIELGIINMVILKDVSRLGREHIDTNYYLEKYFPERKIRVVSLLDHYDSAISTYDELLEIKILLNDMYLRDISKKIRTTIQAKRTMGEYTPKEPPFGYVKSKTVHNHLEVDAYAADIVIRIYRMYLNGYGGTVISRILNEEQIPAPAKYKKEVLKNGYPWNVGKGLWTPATVRGILKNPVYTGAVVIRKSDKTSYKLKYRKAIPLDELELIPDAHEMIISKEEFAQAQQIRKDHRVSYFDKNKEPHKYVGLLFCGKCKTAMRKRYLASHKGYDGYVCGFHLKMGHTYCELNYIPFEKLDELVAFSINQQIKQIKSELENLKLQIKDRKSKFNDRIACLKVNIEKNTEYLKKAYEQFIGDILSKEEYLKLKKMYDTENEQYQKRLDALKNLEKKEMIVIQDTVKWLEQFRLEKITAGQMEREVLVEFIDRIFVYPDQKIDIYFKFAPQIVYADGITQKDEMI